MDKVRVYELCSRYRYHQSAGLSNFSKTSSRSGSSLPSSTIEEDVAIKLKRLIRLEGSGAIGPSKGEKRGLPILLNPRKTEHGVRARARGRTRSKGASRRVRRRRECGREAKTGRGASRPRA